MVVLFIAVLITACFITQRIVYDKFWHRGLFVDIRFDDSYIVEGEESVLCELITNDKLLPLPAVEIDFSMSRNLRFVDEENSAVSDLSYRRDIFSISARQKVTRRLKFKGTRRGYYKISSAGVNTKNIMMTRKYTMNLPQDTDFYVLPKAVSANKIAIHFSKIMGEVVSPKKVYADPFEFAGIREYSMSDPMKYINWKASARTGDLLVNMHETTLSQKVTIFVDMEGINTPAIDALNEEGVRIAASLADKMLSAGITVSIISNATDVISGDLFRINEVSEVRNILYFKKRLACMQADNSLRKIEEFFAPQLRPQTRDESLYVLISKEQKRDLNSQLKIASGKRGCVHIIPFMTIFGERRMDLSADIHWWEC